MMIFSHENPNAEREYRVRRVVIGGRDLLMWFNGKKRLDHDWLCVQDWDDELPDGYVVLAASAETIPPALVLYVYHPSFDPVKPGEVPPSIGPLKQTLVKLKRAEDYQGHECYAAPSTR